jgi:hypothetical protein
VNFGVHRHRPDRAALALPGPGFDPRGRATAEVDGCFLGHLCGHLAAPGQPGHLHLRDAVTRDEEPPSGGLGHLPLVERIDQAEPRPWHRGPGLVSLADSIAAAVVGTITAAAFAGVQVQALALGVPSHAPNARPRH